MSAQCRESRRGFTLVEIMIVVSVIGIIISIAVPSWLKARMRSQAVGCHESQSVMEDAVMQWAMMEGKGAGDKPTFEDLVAHELYLKTRPFCPAGPTPIEVPAVDENTVCPNSIATHKRP